MSWRRGSIERGTSEARTELADSAKSLTPRMAAIWCPDWPVTTARAGTTLTADDPVAVITGNRVVACSHSARQLGIRRGLRRREAQGRCPELVLIPRNQPAEARAFEPILAAIESIAPGVELDRPGLAAIGIRGPVKYFGSETAVLHALTRAIGADDPDGRQVLIGIADGAFAAEQAARRGTIIEAGRSAEFLAPLPIETLDQPELVDLLKRLGIRTLGSFAALPAADVQARFGPVGAWAHRQAGGMDSRPIAGRRPPVEFAVSISLEPPLDRVDSIAFSARGTVEKFVTDLADHGLACTCFELIAQTDRGEETVRRWRHAGVLTAVDITDRIRWQLEGWLNRTGPDAPSGPINLLRLVPVETVPTGAHQRALWGGDGAVDERAHRALARVQTLLGAGSVQTPMLAGGRGPAQRTKLVPWGDTRDGADEAARPWPGRLPSPAPSVIVDPPLPVRVLDGANRSVLVTERGLIPAAPTHLQIEESPYRTNTIVTAWAGPWPVDERWWDPVAARHLVRLQLVDSAGRAYLVCYDMTAERWLLEGVYD